MEEEIRAWNDKTLLDELSRPTNNLEMLIIKEALRRIIIKLNK